MIPPLFDHQVKTIEFIKDKRNVLVTSDPGTAKTRCILEFFRDEVKLNPSLRLLVICPKTIMRAAWAADCNEFTPQLTMAFADPPHKNRMIAFHSDAHIVVLNTDGVSWLAKNIHLLHGENFICCVDEFTAFKNPQAKRTRNLLALADFFVNRVGMSGTPMPRSVLDIFTPALFVDRGHRLGNSFYRFRAQVCVPVPMFQRTEWKDREGAEASVANMLSDISIRYELEDVLDMPKHINRTINTTLSPACRAAYEELVEEGMLLFDTGQVVNAVNSGVVLQKALQICSGAVYDVEGTAVHVHPDRYELVMDLVQERPHSLVAYIWDHQIEILEQMAQARKIPYARFSRDQSSEERDQIKQRFQAGHYQVVFGQPASVAHGLTLTRATTVIWASPPFFNSEHYIQFNRRIYRARQDKRTEVINIASLDTFEEKVYYSLQHKITRQSHFLNLLTRKQDD